MINYVNESDFFKWYESVSKAPISNKKALLDKVHQDYCSTKLSVFTLSPNETVTGKEESYNYNYDDIGCCGASTIYIYF